MFTLDNQTLLFAQIFIGLCLFFYSLFAKGQFGRTTLLIYRLANLSYSIGFSLLLFQSSGNKLLSIITANTLILTGFMLFSAAVLRLLERNPSIAGFIPLAIVNTILFLIFTYIIPNTFLRILIIAISISVCMVYGILLTLKNRNPALGKYARLFIGTSGFYVLVSIFRIIYTMLTNSRIESIFTPDRATSIIFLATIAYHISINSVIFLLVNARARNALKEKVHLLELSYQDIRNINTFFNGQNQMADPEQLYSRISGLLKKRFKIDACAFFLTDRKNNNLNLVFKSGYPDALNQFEQRIPLDYDSSAVQAFTNNSMVTLSIEEYPENALKSILKDAGFKSIYSLPIKSLSGNIGIMSIGWKTGISLQEKEYDIFTLITNQIGTIIENVTQYQEMKQLAETDPLTGILNRREFFRRGTRLLNHMRRYPRSACILIMDLDHFKSVNDEYGHDTGDLVLKKTVEVTEAILRETDLLGRYGGEEFMALLDETDKDNALIIAERLRSNIEKQQLELGNSRLRYSVSIGLTGLNREDTIETALVRADRAMYKAKETGRNRVIAI